MFLLLNLDENCLLMSSFYWKLSFEIKFRLANFHAYVKCNRNRFFFLQIFDWLHFLWLNFNCNIFCLQVLIDNFLVILKICLNFEKIKIKTGQNLSSILILPKTQKSLVSYSRLSHTVRTPFAISPILP